MSAMFPELLTTPLYTNNWPSGTGLGGQNLINDILGVVIVGHVAVALAITLLPVQMLAPVAISVSK
jgi:hypothetical protein